MRVCRFISSHRVRRCLRLYVSLSRCEIDQSVQRSRRASVSPPPSPVPSLTRSAPMRQGYNSFSGDGPEDEDEEEAKADESTARPSNPSSKHPMARFNEATAPRLRGVVASGSDNVKELGQELLDKAWLGDVAAIKHLVAVGADPNFVDREAGWGGVTPLINAATNGQKSAVVTLLVLGAALEGKDVNGWTALHRAAGKGHKSVVVGLIEAGADVSARDSAGNYLSCVTKLRWTGAKLN